MFSVPRGQIPQFHPQPMGRPMNGMRVPVARPNTGGSYAGIMGYHPADMAAFGGGGNNRGRFPGLGGFGAKFK